MFDQQSLLFDDQLITIAQCVTPDVARAGKPAGRLALRCCNAETGMNNGEENDDVGDVTDDEEDSIEGVLGVVTCCSVKGGLRDVCSSGVDPA